MTPISLPHASQTTLTAAAKTVISALTPPPRGAPRTMWKLSEAVAQRFPLVAPPVPPASL